MYKITIVDRFDDYTFGTYKKAYDQGLSDDFIRALAEDAKGVLWIGTKAGGLNRFDPVSELFQHPSIFVNDLSSYSEPNHWYNEIANISINAIAIDQQNTIWLGTDNGLQVYDRQHLSIKVFNGDIFTY